MLGLSRDIQRLPTTLFSLVLRKEYFDYPERHSYTVPVGTLQGTFIGEGRRECVLAVPRWLNLLLYNADSLFVILTGITVVEKLYSV